MIIRTIGMLWLFRFICNVMFCWAVVSAIASMFKNVAGECDQTYNIEKILNCNLFCQENKNAKIESKENKIR